MIANAPLPHRDDSPSQQEDGAFDVSAEPPYFTGRAIGFSGWVDDFAHNIAAVQFSLDGGEHWTQYATPGVTAERGVRWSFAYTPQRPGRYLLSVRAVNGAGSCSDLVSGFAFEVLDPLAFGRESDGRPTTEGAASADTMGRRLTAASFPDAAFSYTAEAAPIPFGSPCLRPMGASSWAGAVLFRSGDLSELTPDEAAFITQALGVRTVYDIRTPFETAARPQPYLLGAKTVALTPDAQRRRKDADKRLIAGVIGKYGAPEERMRHNYRRYAHEYPLIGKALRSIAAEGTPALVHCANGKDRTGVLCATLLRIAGFEREAIMADYLEANAVNAAQIADEEARLGVGMTAEEHAVLMSFLEARPSYLDAFFDEASSAYGGFDAYVREGLRLTPEQVEVLRAMLSRA